MSGTSTGSGQLLPGLTDDLALDCIARVPRIYHGSMRAVSPKWRALIGSSEFYAERKKLGVTDESIFMIPQFVKPPGRLLCLEIDVKTKKQCKAVFVNDAVTEDIFLEGFVCASMGHLVLTFGGHAYSEEKTPSGQLHIFNTLTKSWTRGADMGSPRGSSAFGLIDDKLYVVGGYGDLGSVTDAEVYDARADRWSRIASMPVGMMIDVFWVFRGRLMVRGQIWSERTQKAFSYCPANNQWKEETWLLSLLRHVSPFDLNTVAIMKKNEAVYMAEAEAASRGEDYVYVLNVVKLDDKALKWNEVTTYEDFADEYNCQCGLADERQVRFHGLKESVVVLDHLDQEDEREFKLSRSKKQPELMRLSVQCPSAWSTTAVDA